MPLSHFMRRASASAACFVLSLLICVGLQLYTGAYGSEFGRDSDEPAHYITGLLVRDYIAAGFPGPPMAYAADYYAHYPKVALGHWPPFFYIVQAAWTLPFTASRASVLLLLAVITALTATSLFRLLSDLFPATLAAAATLVFLTLPIVTYFTSGSMSEMLLTLLVLQSVIAYARYLRQPHWRPALAFGLWSSLAILTKGTGVELALIPPLVCLLGRRRDLPRKFTFWLPALVVLAIAAPWYLLAPAADHQSVAPFGGPGLYWGRMFTTLGAWFQMLGPLPAAAALLGVAVTLRSQSRPAIVLPAAATLVSAWICRLTVGAWTDRHLVTTLPLLLCFAAAGTHWLLQRPSAGRLSPPVRAAGPIVLLSLLTGWNIYQTPPKPRFGYSQAAAALLSQPRLNHSAFLVCAGAPGEGMAVAEIAMRESRPGHYVLRASKQLAASDWMGYRYESRFQTAAQVSAYLDQSNIQAILLDPDGLANPHGRLLHEALLGRPDTWRLSARYPRAAGSSDDLLVYQRQPASSPAGATILPNAR